MWFPPLTISVQLVHGKRIATDCQRLTFLPLTPRSSAMAGELLLTDNQASQLLLWLVQIVYLAHPPGTIGQSKCQLMVDTCSSVLHSGYCCCHFFELSGQFPASCLLLSNTAHPNLLKAIFHNVHETVPEFLLLPCRCDSQHQKTSTIIKNIWRN